MKTKGKLYTGNLKAFIAQCSNKNIENKWSTTQEYVSYQNQHVYAKTGLEVDNGVIVAKVANTPQNTDHVADPQKTFAAMQNDERSINQAIRYLRKWDWHKNKQQKQPNIKIPLGIYFYGSHDASKTHLMHGFINHISAQGLLENKSYRLYNWSSLAHLLKDFDGKSWIPGDNRNSIEVSNAKFHEYHCINDDLIIFDDIGSDTASRYDLTVVTSIIETRLAKKRDTFFTSNHSLNELSKILNARIAHKILEMTTSVNIRNEVKNRHEIQKQFQKEYYE